MKIKNCTTCDTSPKIRTQRRSPSRASGNGRYHPIHDFYLICEKCHCMGRWETSSKAKAILSWNKMQKEIIFKKKQEQ